MDVIRYNNDHKQDNNLVDIPFVNILEQEHMVGEVKCFSIVLKLSVGPFFLI